jgi:hypothetical protein
MEGIKMTEGNCKFCESSFCGGNCRGYLINEIVELHKAITDLRKQLAEKDKRIAELESWLKPFHGTPEDVKGYEVCNLDPDTPTGLPMIPEVEVNTEHPLFEPLWQAIKHWNVDTDGKGYAGISGTNVMTIIQAIEKA